MNVKGYIDPLKWLHRPLTLLVLNVGFFGSLPTNEKLFLCVEV